MPALLLKLARDGDTLDATTPMTPQTEAIQRSKEILGGTPVFAGTRVPVKTFLDYLERGNRLDDFLQDFPTVTRQQATQVLQLAKRTLLDPNDESAA